MDTTTKKLIICAVAVLILIGVVGAFKDYERSTPIEEAPIGVVCTMEAKLCPDGSYVGRTGPDCAFALCPAATSSATSTRGNAGGPLLTGELIGTVMIGPTCPVVQNASSTECADKPYQTAVVVSTNGRDVGSQRTDASGRFMFSFLPGTYTVTALGGATLPRCAPQTVTLTKGATTTVTISCDSGIR